MKKRPARRETHATLLGTEALTTAKGGGWVDFDIDVDVPFTYQKIDWEWKDGGVTATDDWQSPPR
jgi:hypothetical protein